MFKKVIKNISLLGVGTLASRVLGFIRDILIANYFGTSGVFEAFIVSFRLPNVFRSVLAEGFSESVTIPVLSEYQGDKRHIFETGNNLLSFFLVVLLLFTITGIIFPRFFVMVIAPGFISEVDKFNLAVSFTRVTFVYLFLIGLSVNISSILYSLRIFFVPAINPIFLNISFITGVLFLNQIFKNYTLIICVLVAGILQVIFPAFFLKRQGFIFRFDFLKSIKDKTINRMFKLFIPRIWSSVVYHLSVFIDTAFSSLGLIVGQGAVASVYYANRLIQFPFALIAISVSRVAIVDLSAYYQQGNMEDFKKLLVFSFQNIFFFIIPLSAVFLFIPQDIIDVVFVRGEFAKSSLTMTSAVLFFYSFGLLFFCGIKLLVNAFYSLKDTAVPAKIATISLLFNVVLSAILMFPLKIGGVALGSSLAAMVNFFFLYYYLEKKIGKINWQDTRVQILKILIVSLVIGILSLFLMRVLNLNKYVRLTIVLIVDSCIFLSGGYLFGFKQIRYLKEWISKKR